jgi:hypothetical protein
MERFPHLKFRNLCICLEFSQNHGSILVTIDLSTESAEELAEEAKKEKPLLINVCKIKKFEG